MKKKVLAVLMSLCLLVGLLPATVWAGGVDEEDYNDYATFKAAAESVTDTTPIYLSHCTFTWPQDGDTLQINRPIVLDTESRSWTIPANMTLVFANYGHVEYLGSFGASLTIYGTVQCPDAGTFPNFQLLKDGADYNTVTIASGGKVTGSHYISDRTIWIVEKGAEVSLDGTVMLGGTLQGKGGSVGSVYVNNTYTGSGDGEPWTAVMEGNLTVGSLKVSPSETQDLASDLIIPSGSNIDLTGSLVMSGFNTLPKLSLNGTLSIRGHQDQIKGILDLGADGILVLAPGTGLYHYDEIGGRKIIGTGTIQAYADVNGSSIDRVPVIWGNIPIMEVVENRAAYTDRIAESITIWCNWDSSCEHDWVETSRTEATCTAAGAIHYTCSKCEETKSEPIPALGHDLSYKAIDNNTIQQTCRRCPHSATGSPSVIDCTYTGATQGASFLASVEWVKPYPKIWEANNDFINAGEKTVYAEIGGVTISCSYTIYQATEYTVTLGNLEQYSSNVTPVTWTTTPPDETAQATVEYQVTTSGTPEWTTQLPTAVGSYPVHVKLTDSQNLVLKTGDEAYTTGTLIISRDPSSGGSSGGSSSSGNKTETERNPDGSTTTTVTRPDGTVTETTKNPDGSQEVVETKKDGTVTTTTTDSSGNKTEVVEYPDGSSKTTVANKDGSSSTTTVDEDGQVETQVKLPASVVDGADGQAIALPMPQVRASADRDEAPVITVDLPSGSSAKVEIPVRRATLGTVAVLVKDDGTETVIKTSLTTDNGVMVTLSDGDTVKIVENSKSFADVPQSYWGSEYIDFVTSREIFSGTGEGHFSPDLPMNRAMIVTVLAALDGVDTSSNGGAWYEAGQRWAMLNGISDGTNMEQSLTREQLAVMLWNYAGRPESNYSLTSYPDWTSTSDWAAQAMTWAVEKGLISNLNGTLAPQGTATRAQVATILMRFVESETK